MYEYQISDEAPRRFRAAAAPHPDAAFAFIVYGDMGESEHKAAKAPGWVACSHSQLCCCMTLLLR